MEIGAGLACLRIGHVQRDDSRRDIDETRRTRLHLLVASRLEERRQPRVLQVQPHLGDGAMTVLILLIVAAQATAQPTPAVIDTTVCEILTNPVAYDGRMVRLRATIRIEFENFTLMSEECPKAEGGIWLGDARARRIPDLGLLLWGTPSPEVLDVNLARGHIELGRRHLCRGWAHETERWSAGTLCRSLSLTGKWQRTINGLTKQQLLKNMIFSRRNGVASTRS